VGVVNIIKALPEDAAALLEIQRLAYRREAEIYQDWNIPPLRETEAELRAAWEGHLILKAMVSVRDEPKLAGSVRGRLAEGTCHLGRLSVHPQFQGQGIGGQLLRELERAMPTAQRFELFTGHRSTQNLAIYRHLGYTPFREEKISEQLTLVFLEKKRG